MTAPEPTNPRCAACGSYNTHSNRRERSALIGGGILSFFWTGCLGLFIGAFAGAMVGAATGGAIVGLVVGLGIPIFMIAAGATSDERQVCADCQNVWKA